MKIPKYHLRTFTSLVEPLQHQCASHWEEGILKWCNMQRIENDRIILNNNPSLTALFPNYFGLLMDDIKELE